MIYCDHYQSQQCQSCQWIETDYPLQLQQKETHLKQQLAKLDLSQLAWFEPFRSPLTAFRNKAKMVVSGAVERPILGIVNEQNQAVDLTDCELYPRHFAEVFLVLKDFIGRAGLVPYNVAKQKGELKFILLTESRYNHELMLRFVLRSENKIPLIQRELAKLQAKLPQLTVITVNIQPQHAAILEGEKEIFLTKQQVLEEQFNQIPLFIRPQGFFQTNPTVAESLYATAQQWIKDLPIDSLWDLFCGVGGFGLHCAKALSEKNPDVKLTGIEISPSAIQAAKKSAEKCGLKNVNFQSLDAANFALKDQQAKPDLVIVNPPRRGIGKVLAQFLNQMCPPFMLYSSCNAVSMGKDLAELSHYQLRKIQLFDMFPHTSHYEVLGLLIRQN
ncbi:23S rRNA (uracil(747)-C(5))-methyltransferase RlmC [Lonepinella koalarum]|uniref:23S rRNA (uracil(747)-C(5))-methyltransferase RlmC n=1 Tax=Lonepinella koalarum TaxID=53417 RepID=A0A4R1KXE2_9PAST|nr:23S rRNA (uracil(747)-C(5))-methyltransferase RlmC [Lonepinella koalarum]MDH2927834.1 23S rRNA (uracil(747)-C(5))-methyltransferase [Lonepinella koalarum]TCK70028.1 23S rRNA m(5)U-747 methyltransferase [Lonepinella koalarum]TFJ90371.1 23S rRNA (uracil(747)-C(5))-methyltransferase RlmC [Lonepinella koalarum]TYG35069.1 23S rRNA (uracil(747)-C(5))-methyltransferase RlmC [Lonepinella koalarum]